MHQGDAPLVTKISKVKPIKGIKKKRQKSINGVLIDSDDGSRPIDSSQKELVVYNPGTSDAGQASSLPSSRAPNHPSRVLSSVGAFAVQCAACFKWRLVPTKEKYEEIREHLLQDPFVCERAQEWRSDVSCDDPADISQDGSRLWAIDKILRIRGEGSTKFADILCCTIRKMLRSMVEVQKYLLEHPEYVDQGVKMSQFSFQIPRPLQENYVRKRSVRFSNACESARVRSSRAVKPADVNPLSWLGPPKADTDLQIDRPDPPPTSVCDPEAPHPWQTNSPAAESAAGCLSSEDMDNNNAGPRRGPQG
ncbi:unnamed protein product [Spirodela intermedia]|uniref:CW-type domain-containing protein n=1 Tax=Spirodela intermedia TaxID=51605 RepID=A0A7I8JPS1_SPIIN|nr:unnamed protein product [Spirodela intermedia]CAA6672120.1 unnamed protein product [Spirodela intermedia]